MYAKPEKVWTAIIYVVEVLFWEPERCGDVCVIITCLTDRWFHKRALQLFINMAGRNKMSGISKLTPLIIFILYYFSCSASVSFSLDDLVTILWMLRKRIKDDDEQSIWFFIITTLPLFVALPIVIIQNYIKTDGPKVKKNDNPFIIMTNYDLFEFFNLWI